MANTTTQNNPTSQADTLQDLIRRTELPQGLPSVVQELKDTVADVVDYAMPNRPLSGIESGAALAARNGLNDVVTGAAKPALNSVSMPKIPVSEAVAARGSAASTAMKATRGGKFFGGLFKGAGRLLGRVVAPIIFVADVMSEKDKLRGVAKATSGLAASSLGWMGGSAIGTGIGTMIMPGVGTAAGYFIGGLVGAAASYALGSSLGTSAYDKLQKNKPAIASALTKGFDIAKGLASKALSSLSEAVSTYGPPAVEKSGDFLSRVFGPLAEGSAERAAPGASEVSPK